MSLELSDRLRPLKVHLRGILPYPLRATYLRGVRDFSDLPRDVQDLVIDLEKMGATRSPIGSARR